jgi:hypothetical protein
MAVKNVPNGAMKRRYQFGMLLALALAAIVGAQASQPADKPTQSAHTPGPDNLEGWTLDSPVPGSGYGDERFAFTLVVARHGHIIRRIPGHPIIWKWIFWADGQQVAYDTGSFHFSETCLLIRLSDGRKLDSYDCYNDLPPVKPDWVKALDATE